MHEDALKQIVETCFQKFHKLPKKGKPKASEWTVLSSVFLYRARDPGDTHLVSLATGTKCLDGETRRRALAGSLVHDSHAEVLARRGLVVWLLDQVARLKAGDHSRFLVATPGGKYSLGAEWRVGMVSTHLPCGDATIFVKQTDLNDNPGDGGCDEPDTKRPRLDLNRTGAKPVAGGGDLLGPGLAYHRAGQLRTKPGRGATTASLSCSDKMLKWAAAGLQGALCSHLLASLHLHTLVIAGDVFHRGALLRALHDRAVSEQCGAGRLHRTEVFNVRTQFEFHRSEARPQPSPDSVVWVDTAGGGTHEALTEGHKQGWARAKLGNPKAWSILCQRNIFRKFCDVYPSLSCLTYADAKKSSPQYKYMKSLGLDIFHQWPSKLQSDFVVDL